MKETSSSQNQKLHELLDALDGKLIVLTSLSDNLKKHQRVRDEITKMLEEIYVNIAELETICGIEECRRVLTQHKTDDKKIVDIFYEVATKMLRNHQLCKTEPGYIIAMLNGLNNEDAQKIISENKDNFISIISSSNDFDTISFNIDVIYQTDKDLLRELLENEAVQNNIIKHLQNVTNINNGNVIKILKIIRELDENKIKAKQDSLYKKIHLQLVQDFNQHHNNPEMLDKNLTILNILYDYHHFSLKDAAYIASAVNMSYIQQIIINNFSRSNLFNDNTANRFVELIRFINHFNQDLAPQILKDEFNRSNITHGNIVEFVALLCNITTYSKVAGQSVTNSVGENQQFLQCLQNAVLDKHFLNKVLMKSLNIDQYDTKRQFIIIDTLFNLIEDLDPPSQQQNPENKKLIKTLFETNKQFILGTLNYFLKTDPHSFADLVNRISGTDQGFANSFMDSQRELIKQHMKGFLDQAVQDPNQNRKEERVQDFMYFASTLNENHHSIVDEVLQENQASLVKCALSSAQTKGDKYCSEYFKKLVLFVRSINPELAISVAKMSPKAPTEQDSPGSSLSSPALAATFQNPKSASHQNLN
jgi:hypothetical protein